MAMETKRLGRFSQEVRVAVGLRRKQMLLSSFEEPAPEWGQTATEDQIRDFVVEWRSLSLILKWLADRRNRAWYVGEKGVCAWRP